MNSPLVLSLALVLNVFVSTAQAVDARLICRSKLLEMAPALYANKELTSPVPLLVPPQVRNIEGRFLFVSRENAMAFDAQSRWLYALSCEGERCQVRRWSTATRALDPDFHVKAPPNAVLIAVSPNGKEIAVANATVIQRHAAETGSPLESFSVPFTDPAISQLIYATDNHLLIAGESGAVGVTDVQNRTSAGRVIRGAEHPGFLNSAGVAVHPNGNYFVASYLDGASQVVNVTTGRGVSGLFVDPPIAMAPQLAGNSNRNVFYHSQARFSVDGEYLVTTHFALVGDSKAHRQVSLWDPEFGTLLRTVTLENASHVLFLKHPAIAHCQTDGAVQVTDFTTNQSLAAIAGAGFPVRAIESTPDGRWLISLTEREISFWDLDAGTHHRLYRNANVIPRFIRLSPDGKHLLVKAQSRVSATLVADRYYLIPVGD